MHRQTEMKAPPLPAPIEPPPAQTQKFPEFALPQQEAQIPVSFMTEDKSFFKRCLDWWNEPVTKITIPKQLN